MWEWPNLEKLWEKHQEAHKEVGLSELLGRSSRHVSIPCSSWALFPGSSTPLVHVCISPQMLLSKEPVYLKCFGERGVTVPNYMAVQRFLVSHFPLTVLLWKYFLLWALSFVFLCGLYNRGFSVLALKQLQGEIGFRQNTQLPLRRQAEKCCLFPKGTLCSVPSPQPPLLHLPFLLLASTTAADLRKGVSLMPSDRFLLAAVLCPWRLGLQGYLWASSLMELLSAAPPNYSFLSAVWTEPCQ